MTTELKTYFPPLRALCAAHIVTNNPNFNCQQNNLLNLRNKLYLQVFLNSVTLRFQREFKDGKVEWKVVSKLGIIYTTFGEYKQKCPEAFDKALADIINMIAMRNLLKGIPIVDIENYYNGKSALEHAICEYTSEIFLQIALALIKAGASTVFLLKDRPLPEDDEQWRSLIMQHRKKF
jgi:hypothetical protein